MVRYEIEILKITAYLMGALHGSIGVVACNILQYMNSNLYFILFLCFAIPFVSLLYMILAYDKYCEKHKILQIKPLLAFKSFFAILLFFMLFLPTWSMIIESILLLIVLHIILFGLFIFVTALVDVYDTRCQK